ARPAESREEAGPPAGSWLHCRPARTLGRQTACGLGCFLGCSQIIKRSQACNLKRGVESKSLLSTNSSVLKVGKKRRVLLSGTAARESKLKNRQSTLWKRSSIRLRSCLFSGCSSAVRYWGVAFR